VPRRTAARSRCTPICRREHTADTTIAQARIAIQAGVAALHLYAPEGRHGYRRPDRELISYFDDVLSEPR
jgi:hypothetical protein